MPLDDLSFDLTPEPRPAPEPPKVPTIDVMTRVLRLPTASKRQARSIVRMQLDRLSPLPAAETVFDLAALRQDRGETVYALGVIRRMALSDPGLTNTRTLVLTRSVEGEDVSFRFRNPNAVDDREERWLKHAPRAAAIALGCAVLLLAGNLRADRWREARLPQIATAQRLENQEARLAIDQAEARTDWRAIERTDAATRFLCVMTRLQTAAPGGIAVLNAASDGDQVTLRPVQNAGVGRFASAGAAKAGATEAAIVFPKTVCG